MLYLARQDGTVMRSRHYVMDNNIFVFVISSISVPVRDESKSNGYPISVLSLDK